MARRRRWHTAVAVAAAAVAVAAAAVAAARPVNPFASPDKNLQALYTWSWAPAAARLTGVCHRAPKRSRRRFKSRSSAGDERSRGDEGPDKAHLARLVIAGRRAAAAGGACGPCRLCVGGVRRSAGCTVSVVRAMVHRHKSTLHKSTGTHWCTCRRILGDLEPPSTRARHQRSPAAVCFIGRLFPTLSRCGWSAPGAQPHGEAKVHPWSGCPTRSRKSRELDG